MKDKIIELLRSKAQEMMENLRTTLTLFVGWYTFFITINFVALAFAVKTIGVSAISIIFILLNAIGIMTCVVTWDHVRKRSKDISQTRKEVWKCVLGDEFKEKMDFSRIPHLCFIGNTRDLPC